MLQFFTFWTRIALVLVVLSAFPFQLSANSFNNVAKPELTAGDNKVSRDKTRQIIANFYKYFNASELDKLYSLISDDFEHELNYDGIEKGKKAFIKHIAANKMHFDEHIGNYTIMLSDDGHSATTKFIVKGKYISTDDSGIPANGQNYELDVINYFEIKNGLIVKGRAYFDQNAWASQMS